LLLLHFMALVFRIGYKSEDPIRDPILFGSSFLIRK